MSGIMFLGCLIVMAALGIIISEVKSTIDKKQFIRRTKNNSLEDNEYW